MPLARPPICPPLGKDSNAPSCARGLRKQNTPHFVRLALWTFLSPRPIRDEDYTTCELWQPIREQDRCTWVDWPVKDCFRLSRGIGVICHIFRREPDHFYYYLRFYRPYRCTYWLFVFLVSWYVFFQFFIGFPLKSPRPEKLAENCMQPARKVHFQMFTRSNGNRNTSNSV